jgi:hypothetical protein
MHHTCKVRRSKQDARWAASGLKSMCTTEVLTASAYLQLPCLHYITYRTLHAPLKRVGTLQCTVTAGLVCNDAILSATQVCSVAHTRKVRAIEQKARRLQMGQCLSALQQCSRHQPTRSGLADNTMLLLLQLLVCNDGTFQCALSHLNVYPKGLAVEQNARRVASGLMSM